MWLSCWNGCGVCVSAIGCVVGEFVNGCEVCVSIIGWGWCVCNWLWSVCLIDCEIGVSLIGCEVCVSVIGCEVGMSVISGAPRSRLEPQPTQNAAPNLRRGSGIVPLAGDARLTALPSDPRWLPGGPICLPKLHTKCLLLAHVVQNLSCGHRCEKKQPASLPVLGRVGTRLHVPLKQLRRL